MTIDRRHRYIPLFRALDLTLMVLAFIAANIVLTDDIRNARFGDLFGLRLTVREVIVLCVFIATWLIIFSLSGFYRSRRLTSVTTEIVDVFKATAISAAVTLAIGSIVAIHSVTPLLGLLLWVTSFILIMSSRFAGRAIADMLHQHDRNIRHVLIVGSGQRALQYAAMMQSQSGLGYHLIGFVDDEWSGLRAVRDASYPVVSNLSGFPAYLNTLVVDEVVVALPLGSFYLTAFDIVQTCERQGILVRCLSELFETHLMHRKTEYFQGMCVTSFYPQKSNGPALVAKRLMDIAVSTALLILFLPLFLAVAIAIKIDTPGPVVFVQSRAGRNRRLFKIFKFRTMVQDADRMLEKLAHLNQEKGPAFKIKNDPRITAVGAFLRRTSIDELPQLFNVLKGDMSLVGPRPIFSWEYERIDDSWVKRRFAVRPGLTGLWQVSGRSTLTFDHRIRMDLYYIDNWSLLLDCELLLKTIPAVISGRGAV